jgi:hypothetical protein
MSGLPRGRRIDYYAINGLGQRVAKLSGPPPDLAGDANDPVR